MRGLSLSRLKEYTYSYFSDNPDVDIYGANLFNQTLHRRQNDVENNQTECSNSTPDIQYDPNAFEETGPSCMSKEERDILGVKSCKSVLVCTGVFNGNGDNGNIDKTEQQRKYNHRDFIMDPDLKVPDKTVPDVLQAVKSIFATQRIAGFS